MLSVENESIVGKDHANEITESGCLDNGINSYVQIFTTGLNSVFVRYVGIKRRYMKGNEMVKILIQLQ